MKLSILIPGGPSAPRFAKLAEDSGFATCYLPDSHVFGRDVYPQLLLCIQETSRIRLGTLVTNTVTRHPTVTASVFATLQQLSGGRMVLGISRGDSALRVLGERLPTTPEFETGLRIIRGLTRGEAIDYRPRRPGREKWFKRDEGETQRVSLLWFDPPQPIPLYVAGYGPKALQLAGELGDAAVIQAPNPSVIEWAASHIRDGAERVGRDAGEIRIVAAGPALVEPDAEKARTRQRWFVETVWHHTANMLQYYDAAELPAALVRGFPSEFRSDYSNYSRRDSEQLSRVPNETVDSLTIHGSAGQCLEKFQALADVGAQEMVLYALTMSPEETEDLIRQFGEKVIPKL